MGSSPIIPTFSFNPKRRYWAGAWLIVVTDGLFQEIAPSRCSVPIMVLERLAKPPGVYSPCRFESYTLRLYEWERISLFAGGYA